MTSEEKMREEFEEFVKGTTVHDAFWCFERSDSGDYVEYVVHHHWQTWEKAWKASRESLVIELPNPISEFNKSDNGFVNPEAQGYDDAIEDCRESIHAAGVKTK